ncbi:PQQ-dependent sugar dehydrogenase [Singulisphaera sp. Ch08]|uniref:PQQ-dependent sugar dehydrogenase n=1 Tax=Singulisphaera sp. Ch08 TaxID=3120278 RepID=A0AAU7CDJ8_9BACT
MRSSYTRDVAGCALVALTFLVGFSLTTPAGAESPFGLSKRVPWNSTRLVGSPEPPLPYTVEKTFTKLTWKKPIYLAEEPGTDLLWVIQEGIAAEQGSRIVRIKDDPATEASELVLDIPKNLVYSVCFHPDYISNGYVYLFSNGPRSASERMNQITRYTVERQSPHKIIPKSEVLIIEWQSSGHDGGDMTFGLDGMFYITTGDGSSDSDTYVSGQTLNDLLGSVLRIDVNKRIGNQAYAVPSDNPFLKTPGARPEIWAYGLRNPWRMGCDAKTGHIWVGTNGQDQWETAHLIGRGENYGWSVYEGSHPFYLERKRGPTPHVPPTIEHSHAEFRSLTGGVVYYGDKLPDLNGAYIYGDYASGRIWGMKHDGQRVLWHRELADTSLLIASFRVDHHGELLIVDHGGGINRLVPAPKDAARTPFPTLLSQTGLFISTANHTIDPAVIPYSVNATGWTDGARAERFMVVPGELKVGFDQGRGWEFPDHTALMQSLTLEREPGNAATRFRVETRIMLREQGEWTGYSYRWNDQQTDATLVNRNGEEADFAMAGPGPQQPGARLKWRFPSRSECMACHSRAAGFVLGVTGSQLNREHDYNGVRDNQLRTLEHIGLFTKALPKAPKDLDTLIDPQDSSQDLERRARTYLQVNCSVCHIEAGGGNAKMVLTLAAPREKMGLLDARPQHDTFGISNAMLVAPGDPERSALVRRLSVRGRGQMPPLVTNRVDDQAVTLLRDWIAQLKPQQTFVKAWEMSDLLPELDQLKSGRSLETGRKVFRETGCIECHRFEGDGGSVGPDLTGIGHRLNSQDLLESILLPSKVIADEYAGVLIETADGAVVTGRVEREDDQVVVLRPPGSGDLLSVEKANILQRRRSELSNMPLGIVNVLRKEQVLDLLGYLQSEQEPKKSGTQ